MSLLSMGMVGLPNLDHILGRRGIGRKVVHSTFSFESFFFTFCYTSLIIVGKSLIDNILSNQAK